MRVAQWVDALHLLIEDQVAIAVYQSSNLRRGRCKPRSATSDSITDHFVLYLRIGDNISMYEYTNLDVLRLLSYVFPSPSLLLWSGSDPHCHQSCYQLRLEKGQL